MAAEDTTQRTEHIRRLIRRRKVADFVFSMTGLALVAASLAVLVTLFGQLVRDGSARLLKTHEVKVDGSSAPMRKELVGTLRKAAGAPATWALQRDAFLLSEAEMPSSAFKQVEGRSAIVEAVMPDPGTPTLVATAVEAADAPPADFSRTRTFGTIVRGDKGWILRTPPLPLDLSSLDAGVIPADGSRVSIDIGRRDTVSLPLRVKEIAVLRPKGFLSSFPSSDPSRAGIKAAIIGSLLVVSVTMVLALPLGVAAGVYMEEYGRKNWFTALIEINIANLAGVPSIIWGLMGLGLFVYTFGFGRSILSAGMTLGLLVLPIVIMATRESLRAIPGAIREASYACGATQWQTVRHHLLPYSMGGILTGAIIGLSRAIGESAPLITVGAVAYLSFLPEFSWSSPLEWLKSQFTVLPIQMFTWVNSPRTGFRANAAAGGMILLALTLSMNAMAIYLRYRLRKRIQW